MPLISNNFILLPKIFILKMNINGKVKINETAALKRQSEIHYNHLKV